MERFEKCLALTDDALTALYELERLDSDNEKIKNAISEIDELNWDYVMLSMYNKK